MSNKGFNEKLAAAAACKVLPPEEMPAHIGHVVAAILRGVGDGGR